MTFKFSTAQSGPGSYIRKGSRVRAQWFAVQDPPVSLTGMQMKVGVTERSVIGVITHVRGDHPVTPTVVDIHVQPDDGGPEVILKPEWIKEVLS